MTSWVLVLAFYSHSKAIVTIQNLKSVNECNRVAKVITDFQSWSVFEYKCVEVINK